METPHDVRHNWDKANVNKNGTLEGNEATAYLDAIRKCGKKYKLKIFDQLSSTEFMAACKDDVFKISFLIAREPLRLVRRGQHLRVPLEIANEMPTDEGISAQALSELDASNEGIGHAREQFALLEQIEEAKAAGL